MKQKSKINSTQISKTLNLIPDKNKESTNSQESIKKIFSSPIHKSTKSNSKEKNLDIIPQNKNLKEEMNKITIDIPYLPQKIIVKPAKDTKIPNQTQEDKLMIISSPCSQNCNINLTNTINNNTDNNRKVSHNDTLSDPNLNKYITPKCREVNVYDNQLKNNCKKTSKISSTESRNRMLKRNIPSSLSQSKLSSYEILIRDLSQGIIELNKEENKEIWKKNSFDLYLNSLKTIKSLSIDYNQRKLIKMIIDGLTETIHGEKNTINNNNTTTITTIERSKKNNDSLKNNNICKHNPMKKTYSEASYINKQKIMNNHHSFKLQEKSTQLMNDNINKIEVIKAKDSTPLRLSESTNNEEAMSIDLDSLYFNDKFVNLTHSVSYSHIPKLNLEHCLSNYNNNTGFNINKKKIIYRSKSKANGNKQKQIKKNNMHQSLSLVKLQKNFN